MPVSIATVSVIKGESAREILESLKIPTITKEFIEECKKENKGITIKKHKDIMILKAIKECSEKYKESLNDLAK
ncbi:MAG: hypothetical protein AB2417_15720 [Clostridiaceae bacterium]